MKLDFVCIGSQKAGTTKLHEIFNNHNSVFLPKEKEAHFFEIEELYKKGINYFFNTFYSNYKGQEQRIGLFDPNLQLDKLYVRRILDEFPKIKILFVLRDPVSRAYSHYKMSKLRGFETNGFLAAIELEDSRLKNPKEYHQGYKTKTKGHFEKNHFGYISRGLYYELLSFLKENMKKSNYKIILFEDLINNLDEISNSICGFLNIPNFEYKIDRKKSNESRDVRYKWVNSFIKESKFSKIMKALTSKKSRAKLKKFITKINSKKSINKKDLDYNTKKIIFDKYFKNEISKIELDFNLDLKNWKY